MAIIKKFKDLKAHYHYSAGVEIIAKPSFANKPLLRRPYVPCVTINELRQRKAVVVTKRNYLLKKLEVLFAVEDVLQFILQTVDKTCGCGQTAVHRIHAKLCCGHSSCCEHLKIYE